MQTIIKEGRWEMRADGSNITQFYILLKVYKEGSRVRSINVRPGTLTSNLAERLCMRLKLLICKSDHITAKAQQFLVRQEKHLCGR